MSLVYGGGYRLSAEIKFMGIFSIFDENCRKKQLFNQSNLTKNGFGHFVFFLSMAASTPVPLTTRKFFFLSTFRSAVMKGLINGRSYCTCTRNPIGGYIVPVCDPTIDRKR